MMILPNRKVNRMHFVSQGFEYGNLIKRLGI